jgi:hypothetical protein
MYSSVDDQGAAEHEQIPGYVFAQADATLITLACLARQGEATGDYDEPTQ